jgi:hypothetical protein
MDIRDWPLDMVMQLPDCCFGRRWSYAYGQEVQEDASAFQLITSALPERFVVWERHQWYAAPLGAGMNDDEFFVQWLLTDDVPTTVAEAATRRILFETDVLAVQGLRCFSGWLHLDRLRMPVQSGGQGLVLAMVSGGSDNATIGAGIVVSSVPKEVPDWLLGQVKGLL